MIETYRSDQRGLTAIDWLHSRHSFSFGDWYDPARMGFGALRVINEDVVAPGAGFPTHGHRDMEIVTYVLSGALAHKDSLGTGSTIRPGEIQRMTAGTGIRHSEMNPSTTTGTHLLQIWILPERPGIEPGYEQTTIAPETIANRFGLIAARDGRDGSVTIHQDAEIHAAKLTTGAEATYAIGEGRRAWIQVATGSVAIDGTTLSQGDAAAVSGERALSITTVSDAEILLFDLA